MMFRGASAWTEMPSYHFSELPYAEISVYVLSFHHMLYNVLNHYAR